jgi:hypothetical protein
MQEEFYELKLFIFTSQSPKEQSDYYRPEHDSVLKLKLQQFLSEGQ